MIQCLIWSALAARHGFETKFLKKNPTMQPQQDFPLGYKPYLDGMRGVAVLAVIVQHSHSGAVSGGFLGVDMFFALSGFLITSLLLREWRMTGRCRFSHFYCRRALRIFPAFGLLVMVFSGYALASGMSDSMIQGEIFPALFYISNWTRAFDLGYPIYLGHTWSLAIEEQFYLLWPAIIALLLTISPNLRTTLRIIKAMLVAVMVWRVYLYLTGASYMRLYNASDTHSDGLLIGSAAACALALPAAPWRARVASAAARFLPLGSAVVVWLFLFAEPHDAAIYLVGYSFVAVVTVAALLALSEGQSDWLRRVLEWPPLIEMGRLSYGLYLWHYPVFVILVEDLGQDRWLVTTVGISMSFALARISFHMVERPALRLKTRFAVPEQVVPSLGAMS